MLHVDKLGLRVVFGRSCPSPGWIFENFLLAFGGIEGAFGRREAQRYRFLAHAFQMFCPGLSGFGFGFGLEGFDALLDQ